MVDKTNLSYIVSSFAPDDLLLGSPGHLQLYNWPVLPEHHGFSDVITKLREPDTIRRFTASSENIMLAKPNLQNWQDYYLKNYDDLQISHTLTCLCGSYHNNWAIYSACYGTYLLDICQEGKSHNMQNICVPKKCRKKEGSFKWWFSYIKH